MINSLLRYIFAFVVIVLVQVLILDNIQISRYAVPFLYVLFLLILPFETPGWLLLLLGFLLGLTIDLFEHTYGLHTAATVFAAWLRPGVLKIFSPRDGYMSNTRPGITDYGAGWFLKYASLIIFVHHFFLFYFEVFSFRHFFSTLWRVIVSTVFTLLLVILSQFFVHKPRTE
jgi:rod shape-determining protein MreD